MITYQIIDLCSATKLFQLSRKHYAMLRQSPMSKQLMIRSIAREADLPPSTASRLVTSFQGANPSEIATESEGRIILLLKLMADV